MLSKRSVNATRSFCSLCALDDVVMRTSEAWAAKLRARHIGDFTRWKEHDSYQKSFDRLLRDLRVETSKQ